jgi:uncharacterized tellurite resistance protein B-like protein
MPARWLAPSVLLRRVIGNSSRGLRRPDSHGTLRSMRSLLGFLGLERPAPDAGDVIRRIAGELERLDPAHARYVAAFAFVLSRVAGADHEITADETAEMERLVREKAALAPDQATLVVEIARTQQRLFGGTDDFLVTRELAGLASYEQKLAIVDCLFAVAAADKSVRVTETNEIATIAKQLRVDPADVRKLRHKYSEHLAARKLGPD